MCAIEHTRKLSSLTIIPPLLLLRPTSPSHPSLPPYLLPSSPPSTLSSFPPCLPPSLPAFLPLLLPSLPPSLPPSFPPCSDTVSRCGLFCALTNAIDCCKTEGIVDVFQAVKALRIQKPGSVVNIEQYQSVFELMQQFLNSFSIYSNFR